MYQSASNNPVLARAWAKAESMDYDMVLRRVGYYVARRFHAWDPNMYAPDEGEAGPRALLAAFLVASNDAVDNNLRNQVSGDIAHDMNEMVLNQGRGRVLAWYPRTMSRFEVEEEGAQA